LKPKRPIPVPAEDIELFRKTVGPVRPVRHDRHVPAPRRRPGRARLAREKRLRGLEESLAGVADGPLVASGDELSHSRPGVPDGVLRKLRRGEFGIDAEMDLHGFTLAEAKKALYPFLAEALARHLRCLRIIHGKGLRSGGSVLKGMVSEVLRHTPAVVAYVSARRGDGGTGAVYVLLSSS
jgi:DNA-nicking Smr family endonuclease